MKGLPIYLSPTHFETTRAFPSLFLHTMSVLQHLTLSSAKWLASGEKPAMEVKRHPSKAKLYLRIDLPVENALHVKVKFYQKTPETTVVEVSRTEGCVVIFNSDVVRPLAQALLGDTQ